MDVIHGLPRARIDVEHGPVSLQMDIRLHRQFPGNFKHLADERVIFRGYVVQRWYVFSGSNKEVHRRLWP